MNMYENKDKSLKQLAKERADSMIYSEKTHTKRVFGTFETQAVTDPTDKFEETNVVKPSDENVKEGREWVDYNKK